MPSRKVVPLPVDGLAGPDSIEVWAGHYLDVAVRGVRSAGVADLPLSPLEPRALTDAQVRALKNVLDRLERFHQHKGRRRGMGELHHYARPLRDRAIAYVLLATGLRREELVRLDLTQVMPNTPAGLGRRKRPTTCDTSARSTHRAAGTGRPPIQP